MCRCGHVENNHYGICKSSWTSHGCIGTDIMAANDDTYPDSPEDERVDETVYCRCTRLRLIPGAHEWPVKEKSNG